MSLLDQADRMLMDNKAPKTKVMSKDLAKYLARAIFEAGDYASDKAQRIQFKGGRYPHAETNLCGFGEEPLADFIQAALDCYAPPKESK